MGPLDIFTFVVLAVLVTVTVYLAVLLGALPGRIAERRGHPQVDAIRVTGWLGLLTLGLLWPVALIWSYTRPGAPAAGLDAQKTLAELTRRVERLEAERGASPEGGAAS
jgi:hypothetical protein